VSAEPSAAIEFPQMFIGMLIGSEIWLPLATAPVPEVVPGAPAALPPVPAPPVLEPPVLEPPVPAPPPHWACPIPSTEIALPQMLIGSVIGSEIWFPLPTPPEPLVVPACAMDDPENVSAAPATAAPATAPARLTLMPPPPSRRAAHARAASTA
jgi:hypothetical protein